MTINEKLISAQRKIEQHERQRVLRENHTKDEKTKLDLRRKILVGEMFLQHFPLAMEFTPGRSATDDDQIFKPLDDFMEALSRCQQCFQAMEDAVLQSR